jgi:hypothetical protein
VLNLTARDEIIQKIGAEIYRRGSCLVPTEELAVIYDGAERDSERFARIRDIALRYHWAFELPGRMTTVTFKQLPPAEPGRANLQTGREAGGGQFA